MGNFKKIVSVCSAAALGLNLAAFSPLSSKAEPAAIVINEICAKNTSYAASDGNFYDWIELYNPTGNTVNLSGYGLTDNEKNLYKFTFPDNTVINAGERLIVFCDSDLTALNGQLAAPMGLSTDGETLILTDKNGTAVDTLTFGIMETNITYGRVPDGSSELAFMNMTPGAANQKNNVIDVDVPEPVLSQPSGFYDNGFSLSLNVPQGTKVYYTLDGSTPTTASSPYTSPISVSDISSSANVLSAITDIVPTTMMGGGVTAPREPVDKAMIVNAIAVDENGNVSDTVTGAYFIGYNNRASYYKDLKVISIVTDKENLFDNEKGIYVLGKTFENWRNSPEYNHMAREWEIPCNYTQKGAEWEREASMQVFEDGKLAHSQNIGIRIHGGATRSAPQKSFNVYARSEYGASKFEFDLFSGSVFSEVKNKVIDKFDTFMLRNGGNDGQYTRFRDKLNQLLVADRDMLTQAMEPSIVFINGEYWGHYEITEKLDEDFVDAHYDVGKSNVCIVKNEELDAGNEETYAEWEQLYQWVKSTDMSNASNYAQLCEKIDIQSFIDYISAEIYYNNWDWGNNNTALWKCTKPDEGNEYSDGKWRFILFDTEYSLNIYNQAPANNDSFNQLTQKDCFISHLLKAAMKNTDFRRQFCTTFMDMANENFNYERVSKLINELSAQYKEFTIDTRDRFWPPANTSNQPGWGGGWGGPAMTTEDSYNEQVSQITSFYQSRFQSITNYLRNFGSLRGNLASITVKNEASKGSVRINTITPDFTSGSWSGKYYTDYPVVLSAEPKSGYRLAYWETSTGEKINTNSAEITLSGDVTVTAVYEQSSEITMGDVNLDGSVNAADLVLMSKYLHGSAALDYEQGTRAELNGDGRINIYDMVALRKLLLK